MVLSHPSGAKKAAELTHQILAEHMASYAEHQMVFHEGDQWIRQHFEGGHLLRPKNSHTRNLLCTQYVIVCKDAPDYFVSPAVHDHVQFLIQMNRNGVHPALGSFPAIQIAVNNLSSNSTLMRALFEYFVLCSCVGFQTSSARFMSCKIFSRDQAF